MIKSTKKPYRTGTTDRIREAAQKLSARGCFSKRDIYFDIDDSDPVCFSSFHRCWYDLRKRGEIERLGREKYQYINSFRPRADVRLRIFRAMHVKGAFCSMDIQRLSGADISYILATIRRLVKRGYLELTGKSDKGNIFRVRHNSKFYQKLVRSE